MTEYLCCFRVEATRNVLAPQFGAFAYYTDYKRIIIPFGKNQELKTGKLAYKKALEVARSLCAQSTCVSIAKMRGGAGVVEYIKQSYEKFYSEWASHD